MPHLAINDFIGIRFKKTTPGTTGWSLLWNLFATRGTTAPLFKPFALTRQIGQRRRGHIHTQHPRSGLICQ